MSQSIYLTAGFWRGTVERAVRTVAQTAAAALVVTATAGGGLHSVDWVLLGSVAGLAGVLSVLTSLSAGAQSGTGPGFGGAELAAGKVVATESPSGVVVAGDAFAADEAGEDIPAGTPVDVVPDLADPSEDNLPDYGDEVHEGLEPPAGFEDGSDGRTVRDH